MSGDGTSLKCLDDIGITELLETDTRPTFVLDLKTPGPNGDRMNIIFCNASARFFDDIRTVVRTETFYPVAPKSPSLNESLASASTLHGSEPSSEPSEADQFQEWATRLSGIDGDTFLPSYTFHGLLWTSTTLRQRWRIVSASQVPNQRKRSQSSRPTSRSSFDQPPSSGTLTPSPLTDSDRALVSLDELDLPTQLAETQKRFKVLTEMSPVGMYYLNPAGDILYCNDMCKTLQLPSKNHHLII